MTGIQTERVEWGETITLRVPPGVKPLAAAAAAKAGMTTGRYVREALEQRLRRDRRRLRLPWTI